MPFALFYFRSPFFFFFFFFFFFLRFFDVLIVAFQTVTAPLSELAVLLDRFLDPSSDVFKVLSQLRDWAERSTNDRERNAFDPNGLKFDRTVAVAEGGLELLKRLVTDPNIVEDTAKLHSLGELVQVLDGLRSEAEVVFEAVEREIDGVRDYQEPKYPLYLREVWALLDSNAVELVSMLMALLEKLMVPRTNQLFSVTHVFVIDGIRNMLTKFVINWMMQARKTVNFDDPLMGFPFMGKTFVERLPMLDSEALRAAFVFLESFGFCLDREVVTVFDKDAPANAGFKAFGDLVLPLLQKVCGPGAASDESTKLFALRMVEVCPMSMFSEEELPVSLFTSVFKESRDPIVLCQAATGLQAVLGFCEDTSQIPQEIIISEAALDALLESMLAAMAFLSGSSPVLSPVECTNTIVCITSTIDSLLGLWGHDERFNHDAFHSTLMRKVPSMTESLALQSKKNMCYSGFSTLGQRCAMSLSSEQVRKILF
jgi:hypothetical protein